MPKPFKDLRNLLAYFITCTRGCITFMQMAAPMDNGEWEDRAPNTFTLTPLLSTLLSVRCYSAPIQSSPLLRVISE